MENILSQQEIDALLQGISSGQVSTSKETPEESKAVKPYDLSHQDRIVQGRIPAVDVMTHRFAHHLMGTFTSALRRMVEVTPVSSEVKKFRDFLKGLVMPTSIHLFRVEPLPGVGMLVLEPNLVYLLIEFIMGGTLEGRLKIEGRDFTNIEMRLIQRLVREALGDLNKAWNSLQAVKVEYERSEMNPQFAAVLLPSDQVLCIHLEMEMEMARGFLVLCLPLAWWNRTGTGSPVGALTGSARSEATQPPSWRISRRPWWNFPWSWAPPGQLWGGSWSFERETHCGWKEAEGVFCL